MSGRWPYRTGGIPDDLFRRGGVPMTKAEVRAVVLASLRLADGQVVWDVGAGTGSVAVEAALCCPGARIYAVERGSEGLDLIEANRRLFGAANLWPVAGTAPACLEELPRPDRVFVGGSGGALAAILEYVAGALRPAGRVVVSAVTLETEAGAFGALRELFGAVQAVRVAAAVTREAGAARLWRAHNPVCLLTAGKG